MESILVALIGGAVTLAGVVASNSRSRAVLEQKVDELSRRAEKHNCLVERTYRLERDVALVMAVLSPLMTEIGKGNELKGGGDE